MRTTWNQIAWQVIARVDASLPADISFADRKKAIREAYPWNERRSWPYKAWLKAQRKYLARYNPAPAGPLLTPLEEAANAPHRCNR